MIKYSLIESSKPVSINEIMLLERKIGFSLPDDICQFYLLNNGGQIEGDRKVFVDEDENELTIKYIAPIKYVCVKSQYTLERLWDTFVVEKK